MKKEIGVILLLGMMFIAVAGLATAAIADLGTFERDSTIELIQTCDTCTFNNISSILLPNGTIILGEVEMTKDGTFYNFSFNDTGNLGQHIVNGFGDPGGTTTTWNYVFTITATGQALDTPQSVLTIGLILILIAIAAFFFYAGNKTEYVPFKIFLTALGALFIMTTVGFSLNAIKSLMLIGSALSGTFVNLYRLMLILISAGGIGLIVYIIYMSLRQFSAYRGLIDKD